MIVLAFLCAATLCTAAPAENALTTLQADPIPAVAKPATKASGLDAPSYIDPVYGTRVFKATDASDLAGATHVRHNYSRRQAFNADNSRYLGAASNGYWVLYDGGTFGMLARSGEGGALRGLAGDAEPIWHPTDPRILFYNQGMAWYAKDVETDRDTLMVDFTGRLPWPGATQVWTKSAQRGERLGLGHDELAFYDALATNEAAVRELGDDTLKKIAVELTQSLRRSVTVDWAQRETVRARLRVMVKTLLRRYKYPPDRQEEATETVLQQAEALSAEWVVA